MGYLTGGRGGSFGGSLGGFVPAMLILPLLATLILLGRHFLVLALVLGVCHVTSASVEVEREPCWVGEEEAWEAASPSARVSFRPY